MALAAASANDTSNLAAEALWELAYQIQREATEAGQPHESVVAARTESFTRYLNAHPFISSLLGSRWGATVALDRHENSRKIHRDDPTEILHALLTILEGDGDNLSGELFNSPQAVSAIRQASHHYLVTVLNQQLATTDDHRRLQRSMYNFAYGLSHELNNPLASIAARASLLAKNADPAAKKSLEAIVGSAMRAHEMLAEMMLAVQEPNLSLEYGDLRQVLKRACANWSMMASQGHIQWREQLCDDFLWAQFDAVAIVEALTAAVRNALDACRAGDSICLIAERVETEDESLEIRVAVLDNGPGLSPAGLEQAWDLYYCGREAGRGLGIGLCKLRRIVEAHHGRVWLESTERAGCSLEIRLPWKRTP